MKKLALIIYLLVSYLISISAQSSYVYQTTFYFENALGEKDTIVMTVDSLYIPMDTFPYYYEYHPELFVGDTVFALNPNKKFEVFTLPWTELGRNELFALDDLVYGLYPDTYHYFRDVTVDYYASPVTQYVETLYFLFKCKRSAMPITVTWDHTYYEGLNGYNGAKWGHFMPEPTKLTIPDAYPGVDFYVNPDKIKCLLYDGTWTFHLGDDSDYSLPFAKLFGFIEGTADTLYGLTLYNDSYYNCSAVSTHQVEEKSMFQLSPNPATSQIVLQIEDALWETLEVLDVAGRSVSVLLRQADSQSAILDTARLPPGILQRPITAERSSFCGAAFCEAIAGWVLTCLFLVGRLFSTIPWLYNGVASREATPLLLEVVFRLTSSDPGLIDRLTLSEPINKPDFRLA